MNRARRTLLAIAATLSAVAPAPAPASDLARDRSAAEEFLRKARVEASRTLPVGVTRPQQLTLSDGERTARAVWKTIDVYKPIQRFSDGGRPEFSFRDSYRHEIAAYELDKLLGLEMVPPTVERKIGGETGSLQLWLEDTITEGERVERGLQAPDPLRWNEQIYDLRLWHHLLDNSDFNNVGNILIDPDFRIYAIDHSRCFRLNKELHRGQELPRFSRNLLARLRVLDYQLLQSRIGRWLSKGQIRSLLARRDLLVELAEAKIAELGEEAALY